MKQQPFTGLLKLTVIAGEVTVKVTVFGPWLLQENEFGFTERLAIPQASLLPPSICEAVIETDPLLGALTVMLWQTAKGATLSTTVTVAEQIAVVAMDIRYGQHHRVDVSDIGATKAAVVE